MWFKLHEPTFRERVMELAHEHWRLLAQFTLLVLVAIYYLPTFARILPPRLDMFGMLDDVSRAAAFLRASIWMVYMKLTGKVSAYYTFEGAARKHKNKPMFIFEGKEYSWDQIYTEANQLAHFWHDQGVKNGDVVAMIIPNKPTFVALWMSFLALGAQPAFINYNLQGESLKHCISILDATLVVYDEDVADNVKALDRSDLPKLYEWRDGLSLTAKEKKSPRKSPGVVVDPDTWSTLSKERMPDSHRRNVQWKDPACYIYTSGTSGLPKAAPTHHAKVATAGLTWAYFSHWKSNDRIYTPLPLYHSSGLFLCVTAAWTVGATVVLSRKFSVRKFWQEVRESDATVVQYIGELCRYLMTAEESSQDKQHKVRMAYGNGMRPDVWLKFKERFGIKVINEFYASTEGNTFLFNYNRSAFGAGAIGRESFAGKVVAGDYLLKTDEDAQDVYRGRNGFCKQAGWNEPGELVVRIDSWHPAKGFKGYKGNKEKTDEKILKDVFKKGDMYFRTGDLLRQDIHGFYYFEDRLGDTFRWKGENVSTSEVAGALNDFEGLDNVAVYGVQLPNHDGRAGCAAVERAVLEKIDLQKLYNHAKERLPKYAVPMFIRACEKLEQTSTHKIVTTRYRKENVDLDKVGDDEIYWAQDGKYVKFNKEDWEAIKSGKKGL